MDFAPKLMSISSSNEDASRKFMALRRIIGSTQASFTAIEKVNIVNIMSYFMVMYLKVSL